MRTKNTPITNYIYGKETFPTLCVRIQAQELSVRSSEAPAIVYDNNHSTPFGQTTSPVRYQFSKRTYFILFYFFIYYFDFVSFFLLKHVHVMKKYI